MVLALVSTTTGNSFFGRYRCRIRERRQTCGRNLVDTSRTWPNTNGLVCWSTTRADSIELVTRMMWAILSNPIGRLPIFSHSYRRRFEAKSFDVEIIR